MAPIEGVDYSWARPTRAQLDAAGARFCVRYLLDAARDRGKALSRAEALTLNSWGRFVVSNFEYEVGGPKRGFAQGVADARTALAEILEIGIPRKVVYFSVDWDMTEVEWPAVAQYLAGCASVIGKENVGVYGGLKVISKAYVAGYRWLWQTYAWSGGVWHANATIHQYRNHAFPDWQGDKCRAMVADYGQWSLTGLESDDMEATEIAGAVIPVPANVDYPEPAPGWVESGATSQPTVGVLLHSINSKGARIGSTVFASANALAELTRDVDSLHAKADMTRVKVEDAQGQITFLANKVDELLARPTGTLPTAAEIAAELIRQLAAQ